MRFFPFNDFAGSFCRGFCCLCRFGVLCRFRCHDVYPLYHAIEGVIEGFGVAPKPCVIRLFPLFRIVRIHHHLVSPNNPHIRELFCLPCTPPFHRKQDISLFSPFTIWVLRLEGNRFPQDKAAYTRTKKLLQAFFQKKRKKFLREIHAKTFTFGLVFAYTIIPPCKRETISSYSSLFIRFTGCSSTSLNSTYPEQSDI